MPGGPRESAFVNVTGWEATCITGRVASALRSAVGFQLGDPIETPEQEVIDWTMVHPDGSEEGNLMGKFLESLSG
jgi:hypothetical protein